MTTEKEQKESMVFYRAFFEAIQMIDNKEVKSDCYEIILNYALNGKIEESDNILIKSIFRLCKPSIDANAERYQRSVENGKKRGAPLGNQNARKNENSLKLPQITTINLSENKNNSIQNKNNSKTIQFNSNNLTVTDTDTYTDTYTETDNDTDTHTVTESQTTPIEVNLCEETSSFVCEDTLNNSISNNNECENVSLNNEGNNTSNNEQKSKNLSELSLNSSASNECNEKIDNNSQSVKNKPLTPKQEQFLNVCEQFKKYFPNKNNKLKNWNELNKINISNININNLIAKIDLSPFLKDRNYLGLEWCLLNYNNIINGVYDNSQNYNAHQHNGNLLPQENTFNCESINSYSQQNPVVQMSSNLFKDINSKSYNEHSHTAQQNGANYYQRNQYQNGGNNKNLTQKQMNDINTLNRYRQANNLYSNEDFDKLFITDYDALMKELEEEGKNN